jgi:hypothetical protein
MIPTGTPMAEYGTALQRTTIFGTGDGGFAWVRRPGRAPTHPQIHLHAALQAASTTAFAFVPSTRCDEGSVYRVGGSRSLFRHLANPDPSAVTSILTELGASLRRLHMTRVGVDARERPGPVHLQRLERCLTGGPLTPPTERLRNLLRCTLGQTRLDDAMAWLRYFSSQPTDVLLHGGPGLGSVVPTESPASPTALLSGDEVYVGDRHADLGWICGELLELHLSGQQRYRQFAQAVCDGYGAFIDWSDLGRACVLRMLTHACDFAAYVGWHDSIQSHVDGVAHACDAISSSPNSIEDVFRTG